MLTVEAKCMCCQMLLSAVHDVFSMYNTTDNVETKPIYVDHVDTNMQSFAMPMQAATLCCIEWVEVYTSLSV